MSAIRWTVLLSMVFMASVAQAQVGTIISERVASRHGLHLAWYAHVEMDPARDEIVHANLSENMLFVQTKRGMIQALNAETGATIWAERVGERHLPTTALGGNEKYAAVTNGLTLYVLDLQTGQEIWHRDLGFLPSTGPVLSDERVYVCCLNGLVVSYNLADPELLAKRFNTTGVVYTQPTVSERSIVCGTSEGFVYGWIPNETKLAFQLQTGDAVNARLGAFGDALFAGSRDGFVFALDNRTGLEQWQFATGAPVNDGPLPTEKHVYAIPELGGMFALDRETGADKWWAQGIHRFVAASPSRVYAMDRVGRLAVLDVTTGARLDVVPTGHLQLSIANPLNDRIYLGSPGGVLVCLREQGLVEPVPHRVEKEAQPAEGDPATEDAAPVDTSAENDF